MKFALEFTLQLRSPITALNLRRNSFYLKSLVLRLKKTVIKIGETEKIIIMTTVYIDSSRC